METLATLADFVESHPQKIGGKLKYFFLGGTAVRLNQEKIDTSIRRNITDFDLLVLDGGQYPGHQCTPESVFEAISLTLEEMPSHVDTVEIDEKPYYFANGESLIGRKVSLLEVCIFLTLVPGNA